jgi:hypothetical protein
MLASFMLIFGQIAADTAYGHVIVNAPAACRYLRDHAISAPAMRASAHVAEKWSRQKVRFYIDAPQTLLRVAHIPHTPYLTAIVGQKSRCVAAAPEWFRGMTLAEQSWLWMVAIASLHHPRIYHIMLHAAENPPQGLFGGLEKWYGKGVADRSILKSEKQASTWLPEKDQPAAKKALVILAHAPDFSGNRWLPDLKRQMSAIG